MVFKTKNNELAIFGQTLTDVTNKLINFNDVIMQGGSFGNNSNRPKIISDNDLFNILSQEEATSIVSTLDNIKNKTDETWNSMDGYLNYLGTQGKGYIKNYVKENQNQVFITEDVIQSSKNARQAQLDHNKAIEQSTISYKAGQLALRGLAMAGNMLAAWLVTKAIQWTVNAIDEAIVTTEEYKEKLSGLKSELSTIESDLSSLNDELSTTNERMSELEAKDTLTFTEKEEYDNLVKQNNELERKIALLEYEQKVKNREKNETFVNTMNSDVNKGEWGYVKNDQTGHITKGNASLYSFVGGMSGSTDTYSMATEQEYINQQIDKRIELAEKLSKLDSETLSASEERKAEISKEIEILENQIGKIDSYLQDKSSEWQSNATEISYINNPTTDDEKALNAWLDFIADFQDKMLIMVGEDSSKENAFNRLVDNWQFDDTVQGLQDLGEQGKVTADMLNDPKYDEFINKLVELGVIDSADNLEDIALAFNKVAEASGELEGIKLFDDFSDTDLGERLEHINTKFEEGALSHKQYFDSLHNEIENFDASNFTDSLEDAQNAAAQFFTDSVQQSASGLSDLISKFDSGEIGISEYLEGYIAIGNTISTLTDELQENSAEWDKNGQAISNSQNQALDATQTKLQGAMVTIEGYQDSIYSLEMMMSGAIEAGSDEFRAHANVIAQDLANIVKNGGEMANEIKNTLGTTTAEIAKSMSESVANQGLASQAIAANTNTAIADMATSIGELFDNLGNAISNFKVDLSFGIKSIDKQAVNILGKELELPKINFSLEAGGESLSTIGNFVSSFGKQLSSNLAPQMIEMPDFSLGLTGDGKNGTYLPSKDITKNYEKALDGIKDSSSSAKEAIKETVETIDFFEERVKKLDNALSLLDANLENVQGSFAKNKLIDAQIGLNSEKINNYTDAMTMYTQKANEALSKLPSDIASKIKNGAVSLTYFTNSEEITKAISEYTKWSDAIDSCKLELAKLREELEKLELSKFQNIVKDFEDMRNIHEGTNSVIDSYIDYYEASGEMVGQAWYEAQKLQSEKMLTMLNQEKEALVKQLNSALNSGRVNLCPAV